MVDFVNNVRSFVNYAICCELCDRMRSEVDCAKSHHRVISEGLLKYIFKGLHCAHCIKFYFPFVLILKPSKPNVDIT